MLSPITHDIGCVKLDMFLELFWSELAVNPRPHEPTIDRAIITPSNPSCSCPLEFSDCYLAGTWRHGIAQDRIPMVEERLYEGSSPSKHPILQVFAHSVKSTRP